jgi:hypothetical protein
MLSRVYSLFEGETPIAGAKVYLAYDRAGKQPVPGYEVQTDEAGMYRLETEHLPPSQKNEYGEYYLIVEKDGYRSYEKQMGFGFMNGYLKNTVKLKPLPKD